MQFSLRCDVFFQSTIPVGYGKWELFSSGSGSVKIDGQWFLRIHNIFMTTLVGNSENVRKRFQKEKEKKKKSSMQFLRNVYNIPPVP